jgi:hemolysin activation/secretion protein
MWLATCSAPALGQASGEATQDQAQAPSAPQSSKQSSQKSLGIQFDPASAAVMKTPRAVEISQGDYELATSGGHKPDGAEGKRGEIVVAPFPLSNPAIGSGVVVVGGYLFPPRKADQISPSSLIGGGGFYTNNGSWAWGVGAKLYLRQDRFRLTLAYGRAQLHYDLYGIGNDAGSLGLSVPVDQGGKALLLESLVRLKGKIFLGPRYQWRSLNAELTGKNIPPDIHIDRAELKSKTSAIGFHFQRDLRDNQFYPKAGTLADAVGDFFQGTLGSDFSYQSYIFAFNKYSGISPRQVLAFRIFGCATSGRVPFYDLCLLGMHNDVRGYDTGRYRDRLMLTSQLEYRRELPKRFGLVAFFGLGEVAPKVGKFNANNLKPAGGMGVRYTLAKKNHVNFRVDYGIGLDGGGVYMGLSEAF